MGKNIKITVFDIAQMQEYLKAMEELEQREPERLPAEVWDKVWPQIQATGEIPAEYRDRIGVNDVTTNNSVDDKNDHILKDNPSKRYYDIEWERWNAEVVKLNKQYNEVILKAICYALNNGIIKKEGQSLFELLNDLKYINAPKISAQRLSKIDFPLDKVNGNVWDFLEETGPQLKLKKYEIITVPNKKGRKKEGTVSYSLDFSSIESNVSITRKLEPYDKRVYLSIAALFNNGHECMTIQQIYNGMGYTGRMSATDIKRINTAITKMSGARLYIDNAAERNAGYNYPPFNYDASLLPMERMQAIISGQPVIAIHVFREPPMVSFARDRKQITTLDIKLLDTPLSKTNANIQLEDYLLGEIAHIKKGTLRNKMLYVTIYENTNIKEKKQIQRAPEKIKKLLEHYIKCGYIKAYKDTGDGVEINF